jgi:toxin YhaV
MGDRRKKPARRKPDRRTAQSTRTAPSASQAMTGVEVMGWTILAHPLFLSQVERLVIAAEREKVDTTGPQRPNTKLLAHILDLALDKVPRGPGNSMYRHGGTLGQDRKNWFRAKTGNGRYRLFYRFQSSTRLIVYAWVNDENSLRTYGRNTDTYAVFAKMLDADNPPNDWDSLVAAASDQAAIGRLRAVATKPIRTSK